MPTPLLAPGALPTPQGSSATISFPKPKAKPTPKPPKQSNRVGISGVWEVQLQRTNGTTTYTHFKLVQKGDVLTGEYLDSSKKRYPIAGSIDGSVVHLVVSLSNGSSIIFHGTESNGTDMLGMVEMPKSTIGFTAAYRPKYNWMDSLNPNPGIGNNQGGVP